jgi:hypothetical protein
MTSLQGPCRLNPGTPAGLAELWFRGRVDRARAHAAAGDRGASVVEWVIISALAVGIAVAVGAILLSKLRDKANSIDLDTSTGIGGGGGGNQGPP